MENEEGIEDDDLADDAVDDEVLSLAKQVIILLIFPLSFVVLKQILFDRKDLRPTSYFVPSHYYLQYIRTRIKSDPMGPANSIQT